MTVEGPRDPMYRPSKGRYYGWYLLALLLVVTAVLLLMSTRLLPREDLEEVLVCNGADCSWFPSEHISDDMSSYCTWTEITRRPPHWACPSFGGR